MKNTKKGFTLIETLVAISIILMASLGPMWVVSQSHSNTVLAKDRIVAAYLAQDALEFVIAKKQQNTLDFLLDDGGGSFDKYYWLRQLKDDDDNWCTGSPCVVDSRLGAEVLSEGPVGDVVDCGGDCPLVMYNEEEGVYGYGTEDGWIESKFTRSVEIEVLEAGAEEARVTVTVSWDHRGKPQEVVFKTFIFNNPL